MISDSSGQKTHYLQWFLKAAVRKHTIYNDFRKQRSENTLFAMISESSGQNTQYQTREREREREREGEKERET